MLSVEQALSIVLQHVRPLPAARMAVAPEILDAVLGEDVASDLDMPPFDKAMMDGFALRYADLRDGKAELAIAGEVLAGSTPKTLVETGQAIRIMTGAPIPQGADAVVMIERCEILPNSQVRVDDPQLAPGKNILPRGREMHAGDVVVAAGARIRPQEIGVLSAVGRTEVKIVRAPRVGVLATGDEIVPPGQKPGPGQIRNSNGPMLAAQVHRAGGVARLLGIARDDVADLSARIRDGLQGDVLILSGGVSAGKLDLVPGVLADLGVQALFHKVAMKPGKPVLFGILPRADMAAAPRLIFGLPGNPVSSLVCFELFVRPALRGLMGLPPGLRWLPARLTRDYTYRTDRPTYHPAALKWGEDGWTIDLVPWFGSPDLRGLGSANAFALLPEGDHVHRAGCMLQVLCVEPT